MITVKNIGTVMDLLEANYGSRLYKDTDRKNVIALWSSMFTKDDPVELLTAVKEYIENEPYPPTVADIKRLMKKNLANGTHTSISDVIENANRLSAANGMHMTENLRTKNAEKVEQFLSPLTKIEIKIIQNREERKGLRFL